MIGYAKNIAALRISRLQNATSAELGSTYNQLSSGLRINKPSVDPAGLSVSAKLTVDARLASRGKLNVSDGISFFNSADGAYEATSQILSRLAELANQSASGAISSSQRSALSAEFNQLKSEVLRLQDSSKFNGRGIVKGDLVARAGATIATNTYNEHFAELSADGRYITYLSGNDLLQRDLQTNSITTIATDAEMKRLQFSSTPFGDTVAYTNTTGEIKVWSRATGLTINAPINPADLLNGGGIAVTISPDGRSVAFLYEQIYDPTDGSHMGATPGLYHLTIFDTVTNTMRGDGGASGFSDDRFQFKFSPDSSALLIGATDFSLGNYGAGLYSVTNLGSGFEFFDDSAMDYVVVGGDNAMYYSSGNVLYKKFSDAAAVAVFTPASGTTLGLASTNGGNTIRMVHSANPLGTNPSGQAQLFSYSVMTGQLEQVTNYTTNAISSVIAIARDGNSVLASSGTARNLYDTRPELTLSIEAGGGANGSVSGSILSLLGAARGIQELRISAQSGALAAASAIRT